MINLKLDMEMIELEKEYKKTNYKLDGLSEKLEELEDERDELEDYSKEIKSQMKDIRSMMLTDKCSNEAIEIDQFLMDFVTASYFTSRTNNSRPMLCHVNITENELQACDGYKAIIIKNSNIPQAIRNKKIMWDVREEFENNISEIKENYIRLHDIYTSLEAFDYACQEITEDEFYKEFKFETEVECGTEMVTFETNYPITVNKLYLDTVLLAFKGEKFSLYTSSPSNPLLFKNEQKSVLLLPIRKLKSFGCY